MFVHLLISWEGFCLVYEIVCWVPLSVFLYKLHSVYTLWFSVEWELWYFGTMWMQNSSRFLILFLPPPRPFTLVLPVSVSTAPSPVICIHSSLQQLCFFVGMRRREAAVSEKSSWGPRQGQATSCFCRSPNFRHQCTLLWLCPPRRWAPSERTVENISPSAWVTVPGFYPNAHTAAL